MHSFKVSIRFLNRAWHVKMLTNEFWKCVFDKSKAFGALLTNLSKPLDCLCHDLFITKLYAYSLDISFLNLLRIIYQTISKKLRWGLFLFLEKCFIWSTRGVYHWCTFGQYFHMCNMFLILSIVYFTGYTDYDTPFGGRKQYKKSNMIFGGSEEKHMIWFSNYQMKLNPD